MPRLASPPRARVALARRASLPPVVINVTLPGGLVWPCVVRLSSRARKSLLRVHAHGKTELVLPHCLGRRIAPGSAAALAAQQAAQDAAFKSAPDILQGMLPWLHKTLNRLFSPARQQELAHTLLEKWSGQAAQDCLPQAVVLPLVEELWHVYVRLPQSPGHGSEHGSDHGSEQGHTSLPPADSSPKQGLASPQGRLRLIQRLLVSGSVETNVARKHDLVADCHAKSHCNSCENCNNDSFSDGNRDSYSDRFCDNKLLLSAAAAEGGKAAPDIVDLSQSGDNSPHMHVSLPLTLQAVGDGLVRGAQGQLIIRGPVEDCRASCLLLQKWLLKRAAKPLEVLLRQLAAGMGAKVRKVQVRSQRGRWGSCSSCGDISLNCRLLLLPLYLVEHVMLHELCHLKHMDHSPQYRQHLALYAPLWKEREKALHEAWKCLPAWSVL